MKNVKITIFILIIIFLSINIYGEKKSKKEEKDGKKVIKKEEYEEGLKNQKKNYKKSVNKMNGNMDVFYKLYDYMGKGYVKLNVDLIFQVVDFENIKSTKFDISFYGKDKSGFSKKEDWSIDKDQFYVNEEGDGILVLDFSIEKGIYNNVKINITGNKGETASVEIPKFKTLNLSDLETKLSEMYLLSNINNCKNRMFLKRRFILIPEIKHVYQKNRKFGFYFEYYHLKTDALYDEGKYKISYKLIYAINDMVIYEKSDVKENVPPNGQVVDFINLASATPGIYKLEVVFEDLMYDEKKVIKKSEYFWLKEKEKEKVNDNEKKDQTKK